MLYYNRYILLWYVLLIETKFQGFSLPSRLSLADECEFWICANVIVLRVGIPTVVWLFANCYTLSIYFLEIYAYLYNFQ